MLSLVTARLWLSVLDAVLFIALLAACAAPGGPVPSAITLQDVWARPARALSASEAHAGGGGNGAVFLRIVNSKAQADRLVGASASIAAAVEIHETIMEEDVMKMRQLEKGIVIPAGGQIELKPGGYHIMLIGLERDLEVGDQFPITLQFEDGGLITSQAVVREP